jgi:hypothetical protein
MPLTPIQASPAPIRVPCQLWQVPQHHPPLQLFARQPTHPPTPAAGTGWLLCCSP